MGLVGRLRLVSGETGHAEFRSCLTFIVIVHVVMNILGLVSWKYSVALLLLDSRWFDGFMIMFAGFIILFIVSIFVAVYLS